MKDYYDILGVEKDADQDTIKKAFRKKAKETHPDANKNDPLAEANFKLVNEANEVLSDPVKRALYDARFTIVFILTPTDIDFGEVEQGRIVQKHITIEHRSGDISRISPRIEHSTWIKRPLLKGTNGKHFPVNAFISIDTSSLSVGTHTGFVSLVADKTYKTTVHISIKAKVVATAAPTPPVSGSVATPQAPFLTKTRFLVGVGGILFTCIALILGNLIFQSVRTTNLVSNLCASTSILVDKPENPSLAYVQVNNMAPVSGKDIRAYLVVNGKDIVNRVGQVWYYEPHEVINSVVLIRVDALVDSALVQVLATEDCHNKVYYPIP